MAEKSKNTPLWPAVLVSAFILIGVLVWRVAFFVPKQSINPSAKPQADTHKDSHDYHT